MNKLVWRGAAGSGWGSGFSHSCREDNLGRHTFFVPSMKGDNETGVWESRGEVGPTQERRATQLHSPAGRLRPGSPAVWWNQSWPSRRPNVSLGLNIQSPRQARWTHTQWHIHVCARGRSCSYFNRTCTIYIHYYMSMHLMFFYWGASTYNINILSIHAN